MLKCRELSQGFSEFCCPDCGEFKYVAFTCKSRFCTSCGKKATEQWVEQLSKELLDVPHRHMVFTIPEELRKVFLKERKLLKELSDCAAKTIISYLWERSKKQKPTPGIVCAIHTFGRDLKWNPHVHALVTEGVLRKDKEWKTLKYFHYEMLRKRWQHLLLKTLKKKLPDSKEVKNLINFLYQQKKRGILCSCEKSDEKCKGSSPVYRKICKPSSHC